MAGRRRLQRQSDKSRPVVTDDFIYDDPDNAKTSVPVNEPISDTPEEAIRKLRRRDPDYESESDHDKQPEDSLSGEESSSSASTVYSSGIMLDENLQPIYPSGKKPRKAHPVIRGILLVFVTLVLLLAVASYIFHRISSTTPGLDLPENGVYREPVGNRRHHALEEIAHHLRFGYLPMFY